MKQLVSFILTFIRNIAIGSEGGSFSQDIGSAAKPATPKVTRATLARVVLPAGWSRSTPRDLPAESAGYSEALIHVSETISVTHYRYTRGIASIPETVNSVIVRDEFANSKTGIQQAVELGIWQSAIELTSKTVPLGDSKTVAHWAQYEMTSADGEKVISQIFVWARFGYFIKLRCSSRPNTSAIEKTLRPLLTALGATSEKKN